MRQRFDGQLALLNRELINMGALCEEAIAVTARSVLDADLRQISAALKMITDMERIGDQALDIAETAGFMGELNEADAELFKRLAQTVVAMVTDSVDAYVSRDPAAARAVARRDDEADRVFTAIKSAMIERLSQHPGDGEYALDLLMIAKYLERIGDHATNIAEWVEFAATGYYKGREVL